MTAIDVSSAETVLVHDGSERGALGAPARDLSGSDIGRLAYRRSLEAVNDQVGQPIRDPDAAPDSEPIGYVTRPDPRKPDIDVVDAVIDELVASGRYAPVEATSKKAKAAAQSDAQEAVVKAAADTPPDDTAGAAESQEA